VKKILVIEADFDVRKSITESLVGEGFVVYDAPSTSIGVEMTIAQRPDLIICDLKLPKVNGYEIINHIRNVPDLATIPLILVSSETDRSLIRLGIDLGADDFLSKPFSLEELICAVGARLTKVSQLEHLIIEEQNQALMLTVAEAAEAERQRIANELHDGVCPLLVGGLMQLERVTEMIANQDNPKLRDAMTYLQNVIYNSITETRNIMNNLSPPALSKNNLISALDKLCSSAKEMSDAEFVFVADCVVTDFPTVISATLYRVVQELINNCLKYAKASKCVITLTSFEDEVLLDYVDNGVGFIKNNLPNQPSESGGRGLSNIENRVRVLGGKVKISSEINKGTSTNISIPLK